MSIMNLLKKLIKNIWLLFACGYGGIFWSDKIKEIEKKIDRKLGIK